MALASKNKQTVLPARFFDGSRSTKGGLIRGVAANVCGDEAGRTSEKVLKFYRNNQWKLQFLRNFSVYHENIALF